MSHQILASKTLTTANLSSKHRSEFVVLHLQMMTSHYRSEEFSMGHKQSIDHVFFEYSPLAHGC